MYKVDKYKFISDTTDNFVKDKIYYLRKTKDGMSEYLTTEKDSYELQVSTGRMSLTSDYNRSYLEKNFEHVKKELYKNYKDFKTTLDNKKGE